MTGPTTGQQLPFRVDFDQATGQLVLTMTFGVPPKQTTRTTTLPSLEQTAVEVALHRHEAFLQHQLAAALTDAAVRHLGADPGRLEQAVRALSDPASTTPVGRILRGTPPTGG